jgi:hypothetical protein
VLSVDLANLQAMEKEQWCCVMSEFCITRVALLMSEEAECACAFSCLQYNKNNVLVDFVLHSTYIK